MNRRPEKEGFRLRVLCEKGGEGTEGDLKMASTSHFSVSDKLGNPIRDWCPDVWAVKGSIELMRYPTDQTVGRHRTSGSKICLFYE